MSLADKNLAMTIFDSNTFFGFSPREKADYSLDALGEMLKSNGVSKAISCSLRGVYYDFKEGNDESVAASREHPWLVPAATIDPRRHLGCLAEVERMRLAKVKAFRFFPDVQGWPLDFLPMRNLLQEIGRLGGVVFLPAGESGAPTRILHLAEALSVPIVMVGANYSNLAEAIACLLASENLYLDTQQLVTPMVLEVLVQEVGIQRIIFGSRAPERHLRAILNVIANSTLKETEKQSILSDNLLRILETVP